MRVLKINCSEMFETYSHSSFQKCFIAECTCLIRAHEHSSKIRTERVKESLVKIFALTKLYKTAGFEMLQTLCWSLYWHAFKEVEKLQRKKYWHSLEFMVPWEETLRARSLLSQKYVCAQSEFSNQYWFITGSDELIGSPPQKVIIGGFLE